MPNQKSFREKAPDRGRVIAYWVTEDKEWRNFYRWKQKRRIVYCLLIISVFITAITLVSYNLLQFTSLTSFLTGLVAGVIVGIIRCPLVAPVIRVVFLRTKDIVITNTGVAMNGKFNFFNNDTSKLEEIQIIDEANPKILQISFNRVTSKGNIARQIYIPIPKGRLGEAVKLMSMLEE